MGVDYTLPAFKSASSQNLPEGLPFARPNAIGPGRGTYLRSHGFDTNGLGDAGGGVA